MPVNKNQQQRMRILISMLCGHQEVNYDTINERLCDEGASSVKISRRTFLRDMETLRNEYQAPLVYSKMDNSWKLTRPWNPGAFMGKSFDCTKALLSERIACSFLPAKMQGQIQDAVGSLIAAKPTRWGRTNFENLQILPPEANFVNGNVFLKIYEAWENKKTIIVSYCDSRGITKDKTFEPHIIAWHNNTWYIKGKLLKNKTLVSETVKDPPKVELLALHRISSVEHTGNSFRSDSEILKQVKKNGLFNFPKIPEVLMEFTGFAARKIEERFKAHPQSIIKKQDDVLQLKLENIAEFEAISLAMSAVGNVRILSPESLRKSMLKIAEDLVKNHQPSPPENT